MPSKELKLQCKLADLLLQRLARFHTAKIEVHISRPLEADKCQGRLTLMFINRLSAITLLQLPASRELKLQCTYTTGKRGPIIDTRTELPEGLTSLQRFDLHDNKRVSF